MIMGKVVSARAMLKTELREGCVLKVPRLQHD